MLLATDIPWLNDAVLTVGADFTADLETHTENGRDVTVLVLQGDSTSDGSIIVDTDRFGVAVDKIRISAFEHVVIEGGVALRGAAVWDVGELVVDAPVLASVGLDNVESITFKTPLPPMVVITDGADVTLKAPSFAGSELWSNAKKLTLISGKPTDSLNFGPLNFEQKVLLSFVPEKITIWSSSTQLELVNHMFQVATDAKFELPAEWVRVLPLEQFQALVDSFLADVGIVAGSSGQPLLDAALPADLLGKFAAPVAAEQVSLPDPGETALLRPIATTVDLPTSVAPLPEFDVADEAALAPAPMLGSDLVIPLALKEVVPSARVVPLAGPLAAALGGGSSATASLLEPLRGLRNAIFQRLTQEFVPGARAALLVEPRPIKTGVEKKTLAE